MDTDGTSRATRSRDLRNQQAHTKAPACSVHASGGNNKETPTTSRNHSLSNPVARHPFATSSPVVSGALAESKEITRHFIQSDSPFSITLRVPQTTQTQIIDNASAFQLASARSSATADAPSTIDDAFEDTDIAAEILALKNSLIVGKSSTIGFGQHTKEKMIIAVITAANYTSTTSAKTAQHNRTHQIITRTKIQKSLNATDLKSEVPLKHTLGKMQFARMVAIQALEGDAPNRDELEGDVLALDNAMLNTLIPALTSVELQSRQVRPTKHIDGPFLACDLHSISSIDSAIHTYQRMSIYLHGAIHFAALPKPNGQVQKQYQVDLRAVQDWIMELSEQRRLVQQLQKDWGTSKGVAYLL